jgi:protocatechuate 3,4-dioxygenase alpha subunit
MSDGNPLVCTPSQTVGPFFQIGMTRHATGRVMGHLAARDLIKLAVVVTDGDGRPVPDAVVEIWQTASAPADDGPAGALTEAVCAFGRLGSTPDGTCEFETVRPDARADANGAVRAGHINVCVFARGLLRQLHTRIYFSGDSALGADPVLALVPEDRRRTLFATPESGQPARWRFHLRLQGADETAFFSE